MEVDEQRSCRHCIYLDILRTRKSAGGIIYGCKHAYRDGTVPKSVNIETQVEDLEKISCRNYNLVTVGDVMLITGRSGKKALFLYCGVVRKGGEKKRLMYNEENMGRVTGFLVVSDDFLSKQKYIEVINKSKDHHRKLINMAQQKRKEYFESFNCM